MIWFQRNNNNPWTHLCPSFASTNSKFPFSCSSFAFERGEKNCVNIRQKHVRCIYRGDPFMKVHWYAWETVCMDYLMHWNENYRNSKKKIHGQYMSKECCRCYASKYCGYCGRVFLQDCIWEHPETKTTKYLRKQPHWKVFILQI